MNRGIVTVTLNPCLDRLVEIPSLTHGGMNRVSATRTDPAGKGLNVSVALKNLGVESLCAGFNYAENGALIETFLINTGIAFDFVRVEGEVRTNIKLVERDTRVMTEINQPGGFVSPERVGALTEKITGLGTLINTGVGKREHPLNSDGGILILSGSRPQGVGEDIYAKLIAGWNGRAFLDTEGAALRAAVFSDKPPFLIKPNLFELETAFGVKLPDKKSAAEFCQRELCEKGTEMVCVSMGGDGAMLVTRAGAWFAPALDIPIRGLAGAGDSMVAGLAAGLLNNKPPEEMLRMAVAAASASVIREGTQMCTREGFNKMMERMTVLKI